MQVRSLTLLGLAALALAAGPTKLSYKPLMRVTPFPVTPNTQFAFLDGATVSIDVGYVKNYDKLLVDYEGNFPITNEWQNETGTLLLSGRGSISEYAQVIESVVFMTTSTDGGPRRITWSYGANTFYLPATGHFYKQVNAMQTSNFATWAQSKGICASMQFLGMQGYLATVTSPQEQVGLGAKLTLSVWLGGSSQENPGQTWSWKTGPEMGTTYYQGLSMYRGGQAVNNAYNGWGRFQPEPLDPVVFNDNIYMAMQVSQYEAVGWWANAANQSGIQGYLCEFGGLDSAEVAAQMDTWHDSVVLELGCELFANAGDCNNNAALGCSWSGRCIATGCRQHATAANCTTNVNCRWSTSGQMGRCVPTACSQNANQASCGADSACVWSSQGCVDAKCSSFNGQQCQCAALSPDCLYISGQCAYKQTLGCSGTDTIFVLDGTVSMASAFSNWPQGFRGVTELIKNSWLTVPNTPAGTPPPTTGTSTVGQRFGFIQYAATPKVRPASGSPGKVSGDLTEINQEIDWQQREFTASTAPRSIMAALQKAGQMFAADDGPMRKKVLVIVSAGNITDAYAVRKEYERNTAAPGGALSGLPAGVTVFGVALQPVTSPTVDSLLAESSLKMLTDWQSTTLPTVLATTLTEFRADIIYGQCNATTPLGALAVQPGIPQQCGAFMTMATCSDNPSCAWSFSANACTRSQCMNWCNEAACTADVTCRFNGVSCVERCARRTQTECAQDASGCLWNTAAARCESLPCQNNPTEDACIADPKKCVYTPTAATKCQLAQCVNVADEATCNSQSGCGWYIGEGCLTDACRGLGIVACGVDTRCMWKSDAGVCSLNRCRAHATERTCSSDFYCLWNVTNAPASCEYRPCFKHNTLADPQPVCQSDVRCSWGPVAGQGDVPLCQTKTCDMQLRACDCAAMDGCVWRNDACKDNRYVQCPMIDVVFMVESTSAMQEDFGRHPNGYYGVVEAIRSWARRAPISANAAATGFRVGMIGYGAANAPFVAPQVNTQAGFPLVFGTTASDFTGAGMELDYYETNIRTYAANANSSIAIKPAFEMAKTIFQRIETVDGAAASGARNKLLVVIGANPITDGINGFNTIISDLETMGVQIFSNVVRRFSTITAADYKAAQFIRPFASDPPSSHFLFTTIEDLTKQLLDDFCDPSTNTGKALQISRDRTLPCSWLQGQTECEMQASCIWDANATMSCPTANGCPNLDCKVLPPYLDEFSCGECSLVSGAFSCMKTNTPAQPPKGLCKVSPCALNCNAAACNGAAGCTQNAASNRCDRAMCTGVGSESACNAQQGCVWDSRQASGQNCRRSMCWSFRSENSCSGFSFTEGASDVLPCVWNSKGFLPAVCQESRCQALNTRSTCEAYVGVTGVKCAFNPVGAPRTCEEKPCPHTTSLGCRSDTKCYWDPFEDPVTGVAGTCKSRGLGECKLSNWGTWTPCSATCGSAVQTRRRRIVQFPTTGDCSQAIAVNGIVEARQCSAQATTNGLPWNSSCTMQCAGHTAPGACADDISCEWNVTCVPKAFQGCAGLDQTGCNAATDMCQWIATLEGATVNFCETKVRRCRWDGDIESPTFTYDNQQGCDNVNLCSWDNGVDTQTLADQLQVNSVMFNPGQPSIFPFPSLTVADDDTYVGGATVVIESNYQRGKDILMLSYPANNLATAWLPASGVLLLTGNATLDEYATAIRFVTFSSTSTTLKPRVITWSFGAGVIYSGYSQHFYKFTSSSTPITWTNARAECQTAFFGRLGYLTTVDSEEEDGVVSSKLRAQGWISGVNYAEGAWRWNTGPENDQQTFWASGGSLPGAFANWAPRAMPEEPQNFPSNSYGSGHPYLSEDGYWYGKSDSDANAFGYICEFGGIETDRPSSVQAGGAMVMGPGGCLSTQCTWHSNEVQCNLDPECSWAGSVCSRGCSARSTVGECSSSSRCVWNTQTTPPVCDNNPCSSLGIRDCNASSTCMWDVAVGCRFRTGCLAYSAEGPCNGDRTCAWVGPTFGGQCNRLTCDELTTQSICVSTAQCQWDSDRGACESSLCKQPRASECTSDRRCTWQEAGVASVGFTPNGGPVSLFATGIPQPGDASTQIDGITIMITSGFQANQDELTVTQNGKQTGPFIVAADSYDPQRGVLTLKKQPGLTVTPLAAFRFIKSSVQFQSTSRSSIQRVVTYVYGYRSVYSQQNKAVIRAIVPTRAATTANTWAAAQASCGSYFGMPGKLAWINNEADSLNVARLQAQGWLGATTVADGTTWMWTDANQAPGQVFWSDVDGVGTPATANDTTLYPTGKQYTSWQTGEPLRSTATAQRFAFLMANGLWMTMTDASPRKPAGYLCQYALPTDGRVIAAQRFVKAAGCFRAPCVEQPQVVCLADPMCVWSAANSSYANATGIQGSCIVDRWCAMTTRPSLCLGRQGCYWDYELGVCGSLKPTACDLLPGPTVGSANGCTSYGGCSWRPNVLNKYTNSFGACMSNQCSDYTQQRAACSNDPLCQWYINPQGTGAGQCLPKVCGFPEASLCFEDDSCTWDRNNSRCMPSPCLAHSTSTACAAADSCQWDTTLSQCSYRRCGTTTGATECNNDRQCAWANGACSYTNCLAYGNRGSNCSSNPNCFFQVSASGATTCEANQCKHFTTQTTCTNGITDVRLAPCAWDGGVCREMTWAERNAPSMPGECVRQVEANLVPLWVLVGLIGVLLLLVLWRLYLSKTGKAPNIFEPSKNTRKFSPHMDYASSLFEEAQQRGEETNVHKGGDADLDRL